MTLSNSGHSPKQTMCHAIQLHCVLSVFMAGSIFTFKDTTRFMMPKSGLFASPDCYDNTRV